MLASFFQPASVAVIGASAMPAPTALLVPTNTMETVEGIERVFGRTRLGQPAKLAQFERLLAAHVDVQRLYREMGAGK
jgi:BioD-like phosphotransacetylase family protein